MTGRIVNRTPACLAAASAPWHYNDGEGEVVDWIA